MSQHKSDQVFLTLSIIGKIQFYAETLCDPSRLGRMSCLIMGILSLLVVILTSWDTHVFADTLAIFPWRNVLRKNVPYLPIWPSLANLWYAALENVIQFYSCTWMGSLPQG